MKAFFLERPSRGIVAPRSDGAAVIFYDGIHYNETAGQTPHGPTVQDKLVAYASIAFGVVGFIVFLGYYLNPVIQKQRERKAEKRRQELLKTCLMSKSELSAASQTDGKRESFESTLFSQDYTGMGASVGVLKPPPRTLSRDVVSTMQGQGSRSAAMAAPTICGPPSPSPVRQFSGPRSF